MKIDYAKLVEYLTDEEWDQLDVYRHHIMRFQDLANNCTTWDEVITALHDRIAFIKDLQTQGAQLVQNTHNDYLFYEIPGEHAIYATLTHLTDTTATFILDDDTKLTAPRSDWTILTNDHLHRRIALLINQTGEIQGIVIPTHFES